MTQFMKWFSTTWLDLFTAALSLRAHCWGSCSMNNDYNFCSPHKSLYDLLNTVCHKLILLWLIIGEEFPLRSDSSRSTWCHNPVQISPGAEPELKGHSANCKSERKDHVTKWLTFSNNSQIYFTAHFDRQNASPNILMN